MNSHSPSAPTQSSGDSEAVSYARPGPPEAATGTDPGGVPGDDPPDGVDEDEFEPL
jgi:hypothetical protein